MTPLADTPEFSAFERLASTIRRSSNFRVAWQLFQCDPPCRATPRTARQILETACAVPELHLFLAPDAQGARSEASAAPVLHQHCEFAPATGSFEAVLACGAADRLGAYSRSFAAATPDEAEEIRKLFDGHGPYSSFELVPGKVPGCTTCQEYNGHLFSDWFYAVAWDWCYCVIWENQKLVMLWCMTDTD